MLNLNAKNISEKSLCSFRLFYFYFIRLSYSIHQKLVKVYVPKHFHTKISLYKGYSYLKKQNLNKERILILEKSFI
jgi:hypothetical protein